MIRPGSVANVFINRAIKHAEAENSMGNQEFNAKEEKDRVSAMENIPMKKAKVIVVTSGKGGVGKSTITGNLGAALAESGSDVIIVDMDIGLRNMDIILGLESRVVFNILDVADGICSLEKALVKSKQSPNLKLLPASQTRNKDALKSDDALEIMKQLRKHADYILVDCPAGIESGFQRSIEVADEILIVVNPEISSLRDSDRVLAILSENEETSSKKSRVIVNRYNEKYSAEGSHLSITDIMDILEAELVGVVPETRLVTRCSNKGALIPAGTEEYTVFSEIALRIKGNDIPVKTSFAQDSKPEKISFIRRLFSLFFGFSERKNTINTART